VVTYLARARHGNGYARLIPGNLPSHRPCAANDLNAAGAAEEEAARVSAISASNPFPPVAG